MPGGVSGGFAKETEGIRLPLGRGGELAAGFFHPLESQFKIASLYHQERKVLLARNCNTGIIKKTRASAKRGKVPFWFFSENRLPSSGRKGQKRCTVESQGPSGVMTAPVTGYSFPQ